MLLSSDILRLRAPEPEDLTLMYGWENDTRLWTYGSTIAPFSRYTLKEYIASGGGDFFEMRQMRLMIVASEGGDCVGMVDLFDYDPFHRRAAAGILIDTRSQRRGYGAEALRLVAHYAFSFLGLHGLYAHVPRCNEASTALFLRAGYAHRGTLADWIRVGADYVDVDIYQLINPNK